MELEYPQNLFRSHIKKFMNKVLPSPRPARGILNSEGFAFCAFAEFQGVDMVIESGICNGGSLTIWAKHFRDQDIPIVGIDLDVKSAPAIHTSIYPNVTILAGDSRKIIPEMIDQFPEKRIGIFIDGPKSHKALALAGQCYGKPNVVLIGIHDLYAKYNHEAENSARTEFDKLGKESVNVCKTFCTDDDSFIADYMWLDNEDGIDYLRPDKYSKYGPTIGVILRP